MFDFLTLEGLPENLAYLVYSLQQPQVVLDLLLVSITFFLILLLLRRSQAAVLLRGVLLIALVAVAVSALLQLPTFTFLLRTALILSLVAVPLIFQPELRRALERLGRSFGFLRIRPTELGVQNVPKLIRATSNLSNRRIGALIVLEGETSLSDVADTGIPLHAALSADLLETIFEDRTPLHDGAVITSEDEITAAACVLPLSEQVLPEGMSQGTRHRAAMGISERADCLAIVVSEETGQISIAENGRLYRNLDPTALRDRLYRFYDPLQASANGLANVTSLRERWLSRRTSSNKSNRDRLEQILRYLATFLIAVLLAVATWLLVADQVNPPQEETIGGIPLRLTNLPEGMSVVTDVPLTVMAEIQAPQDIMASLSEQSFRAIVDLKGLDADVHHVPVEVRGGDEKVRVVEVKPEVLDVELQPVTSQPMTVTVIIPDRDSLPFSYAISGEAIVEPPSVQVSGPATAMENLARAQVTVSIDGSRTTVTDGPTVVLKDSDGNVLPGLTADPDAVRVTVPIRQQFNTRDAPVHVVITGTVAPGYWISNITPDPSSVTLLGPRSVLDEMGGIVDTVPINVAGAAGDIVRRVPLAPPPGISALNESGVTEGSVDVTITVVPQPGNLRLTVPVEVTGARPGDAVSTSPASVDVLLSGPLPVLNQINADPKLVRAIVDISELGPGTHELIPTLIAPEVLNTTMIPNTVQIRIDRPEPSPSPGS
ncbi:MAG: diadenylate cyclase CdaA [Chloroflexota bacterium]|nr:diadenylate cyclase CdaA [Chloroflexota bacterium]